MKSFFANQCSLIRNSSALPTDCEIFTDKSLSNITFTDNDIEEIISSLKQNGISGNLLKIIEDFLSNRYQRIVLKRKSFGWAAVDAGVFQGSILGPSSFLVYNNDLSTGLSSNPRLFADDTSLFSIVHDRNTSTNELNNDFLKIRN